MSADAIERLVAAGMRETAAESKRPLFALVERELSSIGGREAMRWFVPGRIEVLGKHTDYAGGRSLVCAAEYGFAIAAVPRTDCAIRIHDVLRREHAELVLSPDIEPAASGWSVYPAAVVRRVARNFPGPLRGAEIALASDLPAAAGMSSSSALVVATFAVLSAINRLWEREAYAAGISTVDDLAAYLGCIENGQSYGPLAGDAGVGTFGGSEDHAAILASEAGRVKQYSFCPVRFEREIAMPAGGVFVIAVSGCVAEKTGAARASYNRASEAAQSIVKIWRGVSGSTAATLAGTIAGSSVEAVATALRERGASSLVGRLEQFHLESEVIVPQAGDALARGDLTRFGELADRSQSAAETLLGNQVPETAWLARTARTLGATAASAFGAGFGGSVWALVPAADADAFAHRWQDAYAQTRFEGARAARFMVTAPGPPVIALSGALRR